jgi:DNA-binding NarL/FixJ family response regulator
MHLEAALRLKLAPTASPVAIVNAHGLVEDLSQGALSSSSRDAMRTGASLLEKVRTRGRSEDDAYAFDWRLLGCGEWVMREEQDGAGRRRYLVYRSASSARPSRALSSLESKAVELLVHGVSGKQAAAQLGVSEATISNRKESAAAKLGFRDATALLRFAVACTDLTLPVIDIDLTEAERWLLDALETTAAGYSELAALRGTSVHTVRNQLAALRRKLNVSSTSALALRTAPSRTHKHSGESPTS